MNKNVIFYLIAAPLSVLASTLFALSLQPVIDAGIAGNLPLFIKCSISAVLLCLADVLLVYHVDLLCTKIRQHYSRNLRNHYFNLIFQKPVSYFLEKDSSSYLTNLTTDADVIAEKYCESVLLIYRSVWSLALSILAILSTQWILAIYVIPFSFLSVNLPKLFQKHATEGEKEYLVSTDLHLAAAQENIQNHLLIKTHQLMARKRSQYDSITAELEAKAVARNQRIYRCNALAAGVSELSYVSILIFAVILLLFGKLSVGAITSVSQLLGGVMYPFEVLPGHLLSFRAGRDIRQQNERELNDNSKKQEKALPFPPDTKNIRLNNVSFRYQDDLTLHKINMTLQLNRKYAVVGYSGSGKSTLAKLIMGFLAPEEGSIALDNIPLTKIEESSLYQQISYQGQNTFLFNDTLKENILLEKEISSEEWNAIVQATCLHEVWNQLPDREDTKAGENGKNLSGGEAQRIALARCLAAHPKFMILDEVLSALDIQTARKVEQNLLALPDTGMLMITHRLYEENLKQYDSIFVMKEGQICEHGTWAELVNKNGEFCRLIQKKH